MAATITIAPHVGQLGSFKRSLSSTPNIPNGKKLKLPTSEVKAAAPFQATSQRPTRGTNITVPVGRSCFSRLTTGQVAFVQTFDGPNHKIPTSSGGGMLPILSMEELNDLLAQPSNHFPAATAVDLFVETESRSVFERTPDGDRIKWRRLKSKQFQKKTIVVDYGHPIRQFQLDGVVCSRVDGPEEAQSGSRLVPDYECNVAVMGPSVLNLLDNGPIPRSLPHASPLPKREAAHVYLEPVRVICKVFVVLVAIKKPNDMYMLTYELVSSANLDLVSSNGKRFRTNLCIDPAAMTVGERIVLEAHELGSVVDSRFGARGEQAVVNVHVAPLQRTTSVPGAATKPVDAWAIFADRRPVVGRVVRSGLPQRPIGRWNVVNVLNTGISNDQLAAQLVAMQKTIVDLAKTVEKSAEKSALNEKQALLKLKELQKAVSQLTTQNAAIKTEVDAFVESQAEYLSETSEAMVRVRIYEYIDAQLRGEVIDDDEGDETVLREFAEQLIRRYNLKSGYVPFVDGSVPKPSRPQPSADI